MSGTETPIVRFSIDETQFSLELRVCDTDGNLLEEIHDLEKSLGQPISDLEDFRGAFVSFTPPLPVKIKNFEVDVIGRLFLNVKYLDVVTLVHELIHAAITYERVAHGYTGNYLDYSKDNEFEENLTSTVDILLRGLLKFFKSLDFHVPYVLDTAGVDRATGNWRQ
jgi:hypothetical protein